MFLRYNEGWLWSSRSITQHTEHRRLVPGFHVGALLVVFGLGLRVVPLSVGFGLGVIVGIGFLSTGACVGRSEARRGLASALDTLTFGRSGALLEAEGAVRFTVDLTRARLGLSSKGALSLTSGLLALALVRQPCMSRAKPCLTLIKLGEQGAILIHTGLALLNECCDVALHVAVGQAPELLGGPIRHGPRHSVPSEG
jgi:hypothetical protein